MPLPANGSPLSRRRLLATAPLVLAAVTGACARARPAPADGRAGRQVLLVSSRGLEPYSDALARAWQGAAPAFDLRFVQAGDGGAIAGGGFADTYATWGDFRNPATAGRDDAIGLTAYVGEQNIDRAAWLPTLAAGFADADQNLRALPLLPAQVQFYANRPRLNALGIAQPPAAVPWAFEDIVAACTVGRARAADPSTPLIAGLGWGDIDLYGTLVTGLGGALLTAPGRFAVEGAAAATAQLLALARTAAWPPVQGTAGAFQARPGLMGLLDGPADGPPTFAVQGFGDAYAEALFAFYPPGYDGWLVSPTPPPATAAIGRLTPALFPSLPVQPAIPALVPGGLAVPSASPRPDLAVAFAAWLYQADQQRLLAALGLPPVVTDPGVQGDWQDLATANPLWPRFDAARYNQFSAGLPPVLPNARNTGSPRDIAAAVVGAGLQIAYAGTPLTEALTTIQAGLDANFGAG